MTQRTRGPKTAYPGKSCGVGLKLTPIAMAIVEHGRALKGWSRLDFIEWAIRQTDTTTKETTTT